MATSPQFASTPRTAVAQVTAANTGRDGTGTIVSVITGGASGTRIDSVQIVAAGTTTAGMVRLYLHDGTNTRVIDEIPVAAITPSATVQTFMATRQYSLTQPVILPSSSWSLRASTHNAETFNVIAIGGDF